MNSPKRYSPEVRERAVRRAQLGVESICSQLPIAPSTYYHHKALEADPERRADRYRQDDFLTAEIQRVWEENFCIYGARKVWRQLRREGDNVARCTVERLMRGVVRGQRPFTTISDPGQKRALELRKTSRGVKN
tara:strand:+ start:8594 stop:8995 length:402 start_codon:yes stop_codon:yes gene_type:complete